MRSDLILSQTTAALVEVSGLRLNQCRASMVAPPAEELFNRTSVKRSSETRSSLYRRTMTAHTIFVKPLTAGPVAYSLGKWHKISWPV